jgi:UDP-N-acetylmuramate dehydrogenase
MKQMKTLPHLPLFDLFETHRLLKDFTTFGIGGPARYFIEVSSINLMQQLLAFCSQQHLPYFILGKGSNSLFDDRGFHGLVIANRIDFLEDHLNGCWHVGAGYSFSLLGTQTARKGWTGLEFASGIPASVGGAIFMNAGANGQETSESLVSVDYVTAEGELLCLTKEQLSFSYRTSWFQNQLGAIVGATFQLNPLAEARQKQLTIIQYRTKTQPYSDKSAGCVFRNPSEMPAGILIERSGLKGKRIGGAEVSSLHANFIVNKEQASAQDILELIRFISQEVHSQTSVELEHEIRYIPYEGIS